MTRDTQKQQESETLDACRRHCPDFFEVLGSARERERPDFDFVVGENRVGLEVTRYLVSNAKKQEAHTRQKLVKNPDKPVCNMVQVYRDQKDQGNWIKKIQGIVNYRQELDYLILAVDLREWVDGLFGVWEFFETPSDACRRCGLRSIVKQSPMQELQAAAEGDLNEIWLLDRKRLFPIILTPVDWLPRMRNIIGCQ